MSLDSSGTLWYSVYIRNKLLFLIATEKVTTMRNRSIAIVTILIAILTIAIAIIASDNAQYSNPITIEHGKAMIATTNGVVAYSDVEYISGKIVSVKPSAIAVTPSANVPAELPHAGIAHGDYTCTMSNHGVTFTVTQTTECDSK